MLNRLAFVLGFGAILCVVTTTAVYAATNVFHASESEAGARAGNVVVVSDVSASGGSAVKFGTTPEVCPVATPHVPDGPDGMGGCWPGPETTGVPNGTTLTAYTGPETITTPGTVIDSKQVNGELRIKAANVIIRKSNIAGHVYIETGDATIEDSVVDGGHDWPGGAVDGESYFVLRRSEVIGGWGNINCGILGCIVEDTYAHGAYAPPDIDTHNNAWITNGNDGSPTNVTHSTLWCDTPDNGVGGGCTTNLTILGDFAPVGNITVDRNLFMATPSGGYCGTFGWNPSKPYGNEPFNITVTNNVFQRGSSGQCGIWGPVTSFKQANGNIWSNNKFDDGAVVDPAGD